MKKYILFFFLGVIFTIASFFIFLYLPLPKESKKNTNEEKISVDQAENSKKASLDLNGDGELELVTVSPQDPSKPEINGYLVAYNSKNEEIARTPEKFSIPPLVNQIKTYQLDSNNKKEYLWLETIAGPHQFESMFLGLEEDKILPICKTEQPEKIEDCLFYITQDSLIVSDIDENGLMEVAEVVGEYPSTGKLGAEDEQAIEEAFEEAPEEAKKVAAREQGGQGKPVIWGIYSFNGKYFEPQLGKSYDKLFNLLTGGNPEVMKKTEMKKDSIEYIESTRKFWTHR